jgi:hypothetical protein
MFGRAEAAVLIQQWLTPDVLAGSARAHARALRNLPARHVPAKMDAVREVADTCIPGGPQRQTGRETA